MKAEVVKRKKGWEAVELRVVVETEGELADLWHRLNMPGKRVKEWVEDSKDKDAPPLGMDLDSMELWRVVNKVWREVAGK